MPALFLKANLNPGLIIKYVRSVILGMPKEHILHDWGEVSLDINPDLPSQFQKYEDGSTYFEMELSSRRNNLEIPLQSKRLKWYYQAQLTGSELSDGSVRGPFVEGSYAIYHATKKDNVYKAGKVSHLYRPVAVDRTGHTTFMNMKVDKQLDPTMLTLSFPRTWLMLADLPITIDPTFGKTDIGGTTFPIDPQRIRASQGTLTEDGDVTSLHIRVADYTSGNVRLALYDEAGGTPDALLDGGALFAISADTWFQHDISITGLSAADYWIAWWADDAPNNWRTVYDTTTGTVNATFGGVTAQNGWGDPYNDSGTEERQYSLYATYTATSSDPDPVGHWHGP